MRKLILAIAASATVFTFDLTEVDARDYPIRGDAFCIRGDAFGGGAGDCIFSSYEQCRATASGRTAYCAANPALPSAASHLDALGLGRSDERSSRQHRCRHETVTPLHHRSSCRTRAKSHHH